MSREPSPEYDVVRDLVEDWALNDRFRSPSNMWDALQASGLIKDGYPRKRTVQLWAQKVRAEDPDWDAASATPEEFQFAGRLIRHHWLTTSGQVKWITRDEMRKAFWVYQRAPELPLDRLWSIAIGYLLRERTSRDTKVLDYEVLFGVSPAKETGAGDAVQRDWLKVFESATDHLEDFERERLLRIARAHVRSGDLPVPADGQVFSRTILWGVTGRSAPTVPMPDETPPLTDQEEREETDD